MCFVELTKTFDRVRLADIPQKMRIKFLLNNIVHIVKHQNLTPTTQISVRGNITKNVPTASCKGDFLSPTLFNLAMDK